MELDSIFQPPEAGPSNTGNVQSASNTAPQDSTNNPFSPAASMQFPLQVQPPQPPTPSAASSDQSFTGTNASSSTHHPYNSSKVSGTSLLAMRFPFLDGNAADPSQHAGQRVSMFSLRSLLQDHDTSKDPNMPSLATTSAYLGSGGLHHSHEDEAEVYTADPVSTGLMDLSTAHAHFQR